ncbi:MAG: DUF6503 family protein [Saonia sp.]
MKKVFILILLFSVVCCKEKKAVELSAQDIVDRAIVVSGGNLYRKSKISFKFRDRTYKSENSHGQKILQRITQNDSVTIVDIKTNAGFQRFVNDSLLLISDSLSTVYGNSVNSVHYFVNLPYGLNDKAVNKELLGETKMNNIDYYKIKVTFDQEGGGNDFEDTYVYWFNKETFKPDYLAYVFHVNGGGIRFRKAYNERYINGIRFVDYKNYKSKDKNAPILFIDSLYLEGKLQLLSKIALDSIVVSS